MNGWLIRGMHLGSVHTGIVFHLGFGGLVVKLDSLDETKVYKTRDGAMRKMRDVRKENLSHAEHFGNDDLCEYSVVEVSF